MLNKIRNNENFKKTVFLVLVLGFVSSSIFIVRSLTETSDNRSLNRGSSEYRLSQIVKIAPQPSNSAEVQPVSSGGENAAEVKGASDNSPSGCKESNRNTCNAEAIAFQPVCTNIKAPVELNGGTGKENGEVVMVEKNALVEVWKVTAPLAIISGKESVVDSTKSITTYDPVFSAAGDLIDKDLIAAQYYAPGEDREELDRVYDTAQGEVDFAVNISAAFGGSGVGGGTDQAAILDELESMCTDVQGSNPNPDRTNKLANEIVKSFAIPGEPIKPRNNIDPMNQSCVMMDPKEIDLPNSDIWETCVNRKSIFDGIVGGVVSLSKWAECQDDKAACEKVELVGLSIDAMFGSNQYCNEGYCADQYFDYAVASGLSPMDIEEYKDPSVEGNGETLMESHYVTTPCKVRINKKKIYDIPCMWDISPYKAQYDLAARQAVPNDPYFPTWEEYWAGVEKEAERRGGSCSF